MKKIEQSGKVNENGVLTIHHRSIFNALLYHFKNSEVDIVITKKRKTRSYQQNRYYWGVLIPCIQNGLFETQGEWLTKDATHEFLKSNFNYKELVSDNTGEVIKLPISTTETTTLEFEEYQDKCRIFADEFLNIIIPLPNEQATIDL